MQCAVAMEEALQRLTDLTAQNTQQIQALAQAIAGQQAQSSTATQQVQELTQTMVQQQAALTEATQATNRALSQQAELTANAVAATGRLTSDAVNALSQHAESRRPGEVDLHKMIKSPEVFGPTTYKEERDGFLEFRVKMRSWIGALNNDILAKINKVEEDRSEARWSWDRLTDEEQAQARKLHSILTSYTRGRPLRTLKQVANENGFETWRLLVEEHQPHNRARSLQLLNQVLHFRFDNKKSTQENILKFEEYIEEYEKASGDIVQEDLKISVVLGGTEGSMRQHLLLNQKETTKYGTLRQYLLSYEQASRWTTTDLINSGKDHQGQADMDVSRVYDPKGKGKYKGKGKGYGKGRGYPKGKGKNKGRGRGGFYCYKGKGKDEGRGKGKGKGKGKGYGKGGGKGYDSKGKGKGYNTGANLCHYCQKPGHYEANCRLKQRDMQMGTVRNAQEDDEQSTRTQNTTLPSSSASTSTRTTATRTTATASKPTVRQIAMFHMGDEPSSYPEVFELDEDEEEIEIDYFGAVLRVTEVEEFKMFSDDEPQEPQEHDPLLQWYLGRDELQQQEPLCVRAVGEHFFQESDFHERIEVILDSGADVSLVPSWLGQEGTPLRIRPSALQDAQGKKIKTEGRRMLNLTFFDQEGEVCRIQEAFTVASVINPLMAIGKLFREGWELRSSDQEGMCLTDGSSKIPVHLHKNSLEAYAYVQTPSRLQTQNVDYSMIRTVVQLNKHLQEAVDKDEPGWHNTDSLVIVKHGNQENFENPSLMFREEHFPYRSTLVKEDGGWRAIEVSKKYRLRTVPFEAFGEGEKEVVTAISARPIPLWILGTPLDAQERSDQESYGRDYWRIDADKGELVRYHMVPRTVLFNPTGVSGCPVLLGDLEDERQTYGECIYSTELYEHEDNWRTDYEPLREHFRLPWCGQTRFRLKAEAAAEERNRGREHQEEEREDEEKKKDKKDEEMQQAPEDVPEAVEVFEESFFHEGVEYNAKKSSLKELQALCREYEVKTTGSKKQLLKRLATAVREDRLTKQYSQQQEHYRTYSVPAPEAPSEEEKQLHNLTHLPYKPWCPHCVAMKAREDPHTQSLKKASSSTDSSKPVVSFDFCYTSTTGSEESPAVTLVAVDNWIKAVVAVPCKRKGGMSNTAHLAEALVHFSTQLGYNSMVLKADNENAAKAVKDKVQKIRSSLGLTTTLQESIPYDHESNGAAERSIQTVRRHANTLLDELRERTQLSLPHDHPIVSWAFRHASWLLNRFAVSSSTKRTPHEVIQGYPYSGKLVPFGTVVMAKRLKVTKKGDRIWNAGIFLGKTEQDTWIVAQPDGIHITRSVRPLPEQYDPKRTSNIEVHTWNLKQSLLGTRLLPESKERKRAALSALPPVTEEQQLQLENEEAGSDPPVSKKKN